MDFQTLPSFGRGMVIVLRRVLRVNEAPLKFRLSCCEINFGRLGAEIGFWMM